MYSRMFSLIIVSLILLTCVFNVYKIYATNNAEKASLAETRKAAELLCRSVYGPKMLYDMVHYLDVDKSRSADIYIYAKNNQWKDRKSELLDSIYCYRQKLFTYVDSIKNVRKYFNAPVAQSKKLRAFRIKTDYFLKMSTRPHEFISIYTSASKNHKAVLEYRDGLPENYVIEYDLEQHFLKEMDYIAKDFTYYYFGPNRIYVENEKDPDSKIVSICDLKLEIDKQEFSQFSFNNTKPDADLMNQINTTWRKINNTSLNQIFQIDSKYSIEQTDTVKNVPNFRQEDWENIFPNRGSCGVMSAGSVLGYYDSKGFWNITPFVSYNPENGEIKNGRFNILEGANYTANILGEECNIGFGAETMLYEIALDVGYSFQSGLALFGGMYLASYTNTRLGLDFTYLNEYDLLNGGVLGREALYDGIKSEISSDKPLLINVDHWSRSTSGGPYDHKSYHSCAIVACGEHPLVGMKSIGVYTNYAWNIVWWDYDEIQRANVDKIISITSGGTPGTWITEPILIYPGNGNVFEPGNIKFMWQDVEASEYRLQIIPDIDIPVYQNSVNIFTDSTSSTYYLKTPGRYYWRVAPQNSKGNWCHFSEELSFYVNPVNFIQQQNYPNPFNFKQQQNYPNPFNPLTTIEFTLPKSEFVELKVYNILGKEVATLVSNKLNQGNHTYQFDGKNLASGIYFYRIEAGEYHDVKKMILLR